ncbi:type I pantothenate kinase [Porphyromonadaceae bacterium W3.11]|nr:type I pantothenate kinase [Porphyromonadaceae bacterium W3.11]
MSVPEHSQYKSDYSPYYSFSRMEWSRLDSHPDFPFDEIDLSKLQALNEPLTEEEVSDIYLPLCRLLQIHITHYQRLHREYDQFFHRESRHVPYVIGIAGSVAVGKSTTARVLQKLLSMGENMHKVDLLTTDGFLLPNMVLEERGILNRKGFPESYDVRRLLNFLAGIKSGRGHLEVPKYSHLYYDIIPNEVQIIDHPDVLIVEGINVLQVSDVMGYRRRSISVSDFFDFSIYVDANESSIRRWYLDRFIRLQETAFTNPKSFFYRYADLPREEAIQIADQIWESINLRNLTENILPTRLRSQLILEKSDDHKVRGVRLRKV